MPDFTTEQMEKIRFCLDNWERIKYLRECGLFGGSLVLSSIEDHFKPTGELQNRHYHLTQVKELPNIHRVINSFSTCKKIIL